MLSASRASLFPLAEFSKQTTEEHSPADPSSSPKKDDNLIYHSDLKRELSFHSCVIQYEKVKGNRRDTSPTTLIHTLLVTRFYSFGIQQKRFRTSHRLTDEAKNQRMQSSSSSSKLWGILFDLSLLSDNWSSWILSYNSESASDFFANMSNVRRIRRLCGDNIEDDDDEDDNDDDDCILRLFLFFRFALSVRRWLVRKRFCCIPKE